MNYILNIRLIANEKFHAIALGQEGSLTQEQVNGQVEKNDIARNEIMHLRARLSELSESISVSGSNWARSKATDEFVKGVESGQKIENGFFGTLMSAIKNVFSFANKAKLEETKSDLRATTNGLADKNEDRVTIPEKNRSQEVEKLQEVEVDLTPQASVGVEAENIPKAPALAASRPAVKLEELTALEPMEPVVTQHTMGEEVSTPASAPIASEASSIPTPPPLPPQANAGVKASNIPDAPPLPPQADAGVKASNIPKTPPLSPQADAGAEVASTPISAQGDLLESIRRRGEERQKEKESKISQDHMNDQGERDFIYKKAEQVKEVSDSGIMGALKDKMGSEGKINPNNVLDGQSKEAQMNMLYSAIIDGNEELVKAFKSHETEYDTGRVDDDWGEPIMESGATFSEEALELVENAVIETNARVERGEHLPAPEVEEVQKEPKATTPEKAGVVKEKSDVSKSVSSSSSEVGKSSIPEAPPMPTKKSVVTKAKVSKPKAPKPTAPAPDTASLMDEIRNTKLGSSKSKSGSAGLDMDGFTHIKTKELEKDDPVAARLASIRGAVASDDFADELEEMSSKQQLNTLYTAVIDGDKKKIQQIQEIQGDEYNYVDVFTPEAVTKICEAAVKVAATQKVAKKIIIEKAVQTTAKEFKVEASVNQSKSQGR